MERYLEIIRSSFVGYAEYLYRDVTQPTWRSYFYLLVVVSLVLFAWEQLGPWRKDQPRFRRDFWLDGFYMFFNFFLFSLIGYNALSNVAVAAFNDLLRHGFGIENVVALHIEAWPVWLQLLLMFVLRDFIHYWVHRLLHRVAWLWRFHQVHHSVLQMGFAAHLRFHFMETIVYRSIEYLPLAMIGFGIDEFFLVHTVALLVGHWNHGNVRLPLGPLRYLVNSPQFHIWHHVKRLPAGTYGVNYALTLTVWDYLFKTAYEPEDGRDLELGFEGVESYPTGFWAQVVEPFRRR